MPGAQKSARNGEETYQSLRTPPLYARGHPWIPANYLPRRKDYTASPRASGGSSQNPRDLWLETKRQLPLKEDSVHPPYSLARPRRRGLVRHENTLIKKQRRCGLSDQPSLLRAVVPRTEAHLTVKHTSYSIPTKGNMTPPFHFTLPSVHLHDPTIPQHQRSNKKTDQ